MCMLPRINSASRCVLEKQMILNDSLIEKYCMFGNSKKSSSQSSTLVCDML